jgi:hypothetical protein
METKKKVWLLEESVGVQRLFLILKIAQGEEFRA